MSIRSQCMWQFESKRWARRTGGRAGIPWPGQAGTEAGRPLAAANGWAGRYLAMVARGQGEGAGRDCVTYRAEGVGARLVPERCLHRNKTK